MKAQVYPEHCNFYQVEGKLMMHGAELLKFGDRQAAILCKELLEGTGLVPLTVGVDKCQFYHGPVLGDLLDIQVKVDSYGKHRITIFCEIFSPKGKCFDGYFAFCSFNSNYKMSPHNLG